MALLLFPYGAISFSSAKKASSFSCCLVCSLHQHLIDPFQACLKRCAIACFPAFIGVFLFPCKFSFVSLLCILSSVKFIEK